MNTRRSFVNCGACLIAGFAFFISIVCADEINIVCTKDYASAQVDQAAITRVLGELAHQCGITVVMDAPLAQTVSLEVERATLPRVVGRILRGHNFTLRYAHPAAASGNWLWVFADIPTVPPAARIVLAMPTDKQDAIYRIADGEKSTAMVELLTALGDADPEVREAAVETLADIGGSDAALSMAAVVNDPNVDIRETAADTLGQIGGTTAIELLRQMSLDREPAVSRAAAENLRELDGAR